LENYDGGDYGGYGDGDYAINAYEYSLEKLEPKPIVFECYTCHFTKMKFHEHGMPNCDVPFRAEGVPVLRCEGLCATTKSIIGRDEYMITRSCLPNCQTIYDVISTVECCYGHRCNGSSTGTRIQPLCGTWISLLHLLYVTYCASSLT
jgi:hypothetical protein